MKDKRSGRDNIILVLSLLVATGLAACLCMLFYRQAQEKQTDAYDLVILGDSIMGKERITPPFIHAILEEQTGMTVYNGAFGGSCASTGNPDNRYSYHEESLNLCSLVDAICAEDYGVALADMPNNPFKSYYFDDTIEGLSKIDFDQVQVLLLQHGMNDYAGGRPLDNPDNPYDITTFGGAMRYAIERFQTRFPDMKLVLVTPAFCWIDNYDICSVQDFGYGTLEDYTNLKIQIGKEYGLDVIDVFHEVGFDETNIIDLTEDGIHLNFEGRERYAEYISRRLNEIL